MKGRLFQPVEGGKASVTVGEVESPSAWVHKGVSRAAHYDHGCLMNLYIRWQEKDEGSRSQLKIDAMTSLNETSYQMMM